ncbi:hypothetical protein HU200_054783 [Digitaria exilis]|uniref:Uncharacterized protein n=1 Tax=Digitaria exilis TaxID=1010633 RepID=A0A835AJZ7_9POAL|nr:hypothetical protein HU200_054783 [Digitaria exilis]
MATELDVSKSRRFDIAMSRRTRRSTSLAACFQDQDVPSQQRHQELKAFLEGQDAEVKALQQCDYADQLIPCPDEDEELKIPRAPLQCEDDGQKTPKQYQDEQENKSEQYSGGEQKKPEHYQGEKEKKPEQHTDEEKNMPEQYQDEDEETPQYQEEVLRTQNQHEDVEEAAAERYQEPEQKTPQQHQETDEREEEQKAGQKCCNTEQKAPEQFQGEKLATPPRAIDNVPRFSLQELIQQKQLQTGDTKHTNKLGGHGESVLPDHKVSGSGGAAAGGTTLAMVIKRPEGGKKSMGMIRRCVKALNQMIKTKHGSKKNLHL